MKYLSLLYKIAAPPDSLPQPVYFHGSSKEDGISDIFAEGLEGRDVQGKGKMAPVKGGVYLSPDFRYAMIYAIGGVIMGSSFRELPESEQYGFIYTVPKKSLQDVHPDEDSLGELVYHNFDKPEYSWLTRIAEQVATPLQLKKLKQGVYAEFAAVGKKILKKLTDAQKLRIINSGSHLFNLGKVPVSGCYVLRRDHTEVLTGDLDKDSKYMVFITKAEELPAAKERLNAKFKKL